MSRIIIRNSQDSSNIPLLAWEQVTYTGTVPRWLAQREVHYSPVSQQLLTHSGNPLNSGIYSDSVFALNPLTLESVMLDTTNASGANNSSAPDYPDSTAGAWNNGDGATDPNFPPDRHPDFQGCIDTFRNCWWQLGGLSIGNPPSGDGITYNDLRSFSLTADPADGEWTLHDDMENTPTTNYNCELLYLPGVDLLWFHGVAGNTRTHVYAPTDSLSADQTAAGCVAPKTWALTHNVSAEPPHSALAPAVYDAPRNRVLLFVWDHSSSSTTLQVWAYSVPGKTWTNLNPDGAPLMSGPLTGHDYATVPLTVGRWAGNILFIRTSHKFVGDATQAAAYLYRPSVDTFTQINTTGTGPHRVAINAPAPMLGSHGGVVSHESNGQMWHGVLS